MYTFMVFIRNKGEPAKRVLRFTVDAISIQHCCNMVASHFPNRYISAKQLTEQWEDIYYRSIPK